MSNMGSIKYSLSCIAQNISELVAKKRYGGSFISDLKQFTDGKKVYIDMSIEGKEDEELDNEKVYCFHNDKNLVITLTKGENFKRCEGEKKDKLLALIAKCKKVSVDCKKTRVKMVQKMCEEKNLKLEIIYKCLGIKLSSVFKFTCRDIYSNAGSKPNYDKCRFYSSKESNSFFIYDQDQKDRNIEKVKVKEKVFEGKTVINFDKDKEMKGYGDVEDVINILYGLNYVSDIECIKGRYKEIKDINIHIPSGSNLDTIYGDEEWDKKQIYRKEDGDMIILKDSDRNAKQIRKISDMHNVKNVWKLIETYYDREKIPNGRFDFLIKYGATKDKSALDKWIKEDLLKGYDKIFFEGELKKSEEVYEGLSFKKKFLFIIDRSRATFWLNVLNMVKKYIKILLNVKIQKMGLKK